MAEILKYLVEEYRIKTSGEVAWGLHKENLKKKTVSESCAKEIPEEIFQWFYGSINKEYVEKLLDEFIKKNTWKMSEVTWSNPCNIISFKEIVGGISKRIAGRISAYIVRPQALCKKYRMIFFLRKWQGNTWNSSYWILDDYCNGTIVLKSF